MSDSGIQLCSVGTCLVSDKAIWHVCFESLLISLVYRSNTIQTTLISVREPRLLTHNVSICFVIFQSIPLFEVECNTTGQVRRLFSSWVEHLIGSLTHPVSQRMEWDGCMALSDLTGLLLAWTGSLSILRWGGIALETQLHHTLTFTFSRTFKSVSKYHNVKIMPNTNSPHVSMQRRIIISVTTRGGKKSPVDKSHFNFPTGPLWSRSPFGGHSLFKQGGEWPLLPTWAWG